MIDIEGLSLSEEDIFVLSNKNVGGLILFSRNYESIEQLQNLISEVNDIKKNIIISVDQEGGRVQRFHEDFTTIPSNGKPNWDNVRSKLIVSCSWYGYSSVPAVIVTVHWMLPGTASASAVIKNQSKTVEDLSPAGIVISPRGEPLNLI